jgi:hypothetical protein
MEIGNRAPNGLRFGIKVASMLGRFLKNHVLGGRNASRL